MPAALTRADIRARVAAGTVRATMTVDGEVFQTGTVKVPLISNATLLDARTADRPLPLIAEGNAHVALVAGPATFSATLEWGSSITTSPGRGSFVLPVPPAGSVTATFDVPGEQSDLRVSPGLVLRRTSAARPHDRRSDARSRIGDAGLVVVERNRTRRRRRATCGCSPT